MSNESSIVAHLFWRRRCSISILFMRACCVQYMACHSVPLAHHLHAFAKISSSLSAQRAGAELNAGRCQGALLVFLVSEVVRLPYQWTAPVQIALCMHGQLLVTTAFELDVA